MVKKVKSGKNKKNLKEVNWVLVLIMSVVFGQLGVDRFIMGKVGTGILKLITFGGFGIWWLIDVILIATKHPYKGIKWVR
jgi:TM2 domain-containing membrane protein YozV